LDAGRLAKVLSCAASSSDPGKGEIHISRPIGNFDTTASRIGWQVALLQKFKSKGINSGSPGIGQIDSKRAKRHFL